MLYRDDVVAHVLLATPEGKLGVLRFEIHQSSSCGKSLTGWDGVGETAGGLQHPNESDILWITESSESIEALFAD